MLIMRGSQKRIKVTLEGVLPNVSPDSRVRMTEALIQASLLNNHAILGKFPPKPQFPRLYNGASYHYLLQGIVMRIQWVNKDEALSPCLSHGECPVNVNCCCRATAGHNICAS